MRRILVPAGVEENVSAMQAEALHRELVSGAVDFAQKAKESANDKSNGLTHSLRVAKKNMHLSALPLCLKMLAIFLG